MFKRHFLVPLVSGLKKNLASKPLLFFSFSSPRSSDELKRAIWLVERTLFPAEHIQWLLFGISFRDFLERAKFRTAILSKKKKHARYFNQAGKKWLPWRRLCKYTKATKRDANFCQGVLRRKNIVLPVITINKGRVKIYWITERQ